MPRGRQGGPADMGQRLSAQFAQLEASWWGIDQLVERLLGPGGGMHAWAIATAALVAVACGLVGTLRSCGA